MPIPTAFFHLARRTRSDVSLSRVNLRVAALVVDTLQAPDDSDLPRAASDMDEEMMRRYGLLSRPGR